MQDSKPEAKPQVVAAEPGAVRWARYDGDYVAETAGKAARQTARVARNLVRTAPAEVYAVGFQQGEMATADRFSGKAVSFIPVARFAAPPPWPPVLPAPAMPVAYRADHRDP